MFAATTSSPTNRLSDLSCISFLAAYPQPAFIVQKSRHHDQTTPSINPIFGNSPFRKLLLGPDADSAELGVVFLRALETVEQAGRYSAWLELAKTATSDSNDDSIIADDVGTLHVQLRLAWLPLNAERVELELWRTPVEDYIVCTSALRSPVPKHVPPTRTRTSSDSGRPDRGMRLPNFPPPLSYSEPARTPTASLYESPVLQSGSGQSMKEMVHNFAWENTPLGPRCQWSSALFSAVDYILCHPWPKAIWWGKELVLIYNDAYKELVAHKHPHIFAEHGSVSWAELWDAIGPAVDKVFSGTAVWKMDDLLFLARMTEACLPEETYQSWNWVNATLCYTILMYLICRFPLHKVPFREGPGKGVAGFINGTIGE